jgi:hypothetical protein
VGQRFEVLLLGVRCFGPLPSDWFVELNLPGTFCYLVLLVCGFYTALTWSIQFLGFSFGLFLSTLFSLGGGYDSWSIPVPFLD